MKTLFYISCIILTGIIFLSLFCSCGRDMVIDGKERGTIGIVNLIVNDPSLIEPKYADVQYRVIWGAILCETIIAPIYFFGFSIWEPVGPYNISGVK